MNIAEPSPLKMHLMPVDVLPELTDFCDALALYERKRGDRLMPSWSDFSVVEFDGWHSRVALSQREGDDFRFRIFGTTFVELFARDLTGELLIASMVPEQIEGTRHHFMSLVNGPKLGLATGWVPAEGRGFMRFEVLDLPLVGSDGAVSHFLHVCLPPHLSD